MSNERRVKAKYVLFLRITRYSSLVLGWHLDGELFGDDLDVTGEVVEQVFALVGAEQAEHRVYLRQQIGLHGEEARLSRRGQADLNRATVRAVLFAHDQR